MKPLGFVPNTVIHVDGSVTRSNKGDVPGHEFHGNQWTSGGDLARGKAAERAKTPEEHRAAAQYHREQAAATSNARVANAHEYAAGEHESAAHAHEYASTHATPGNHSAENWAAGVSDGARAASNGAHYVDRYIEGGRSKR